MNIPLFIAHRGASFEAPENTLAAFELAWEQGADGIEGDFRLTRDGEIVCIHDETAKRTAEADMKVAGSSLAELRRLDAGAWKGEAWRGCRIPTLQELLATVPANGMMFIEVKCGPEILPPLARTLAQSGLQPEQIFIISFQNQVIAETKRGIPGVNAYWLTGFTISETSGRITPSSKEIVKTLEQSGADGAGCQYHSFIDQAFVHALQSAHKKLNIWTVDEIDTANRLSKLGADFITSNRAGWLKENISAAADKKSKPGLDSPEDTR